MSDGSVVVNASITATNKSTGQVFSGSTDNEGRYRIPVSPGIYDLVLELPNFKPKPFQILDTHNFSFDNHTRIMFFTSSLGLTSPPIPVPPILSLPIAP
jgi:hypothetical protein